VGRAEFSWSGFLRERRSGPTAEERQQDAWLSNPVLNPGGVDRGVDTDTDAPTAPGRAAARELAPRDEEPDEHDDTVHPRRDVDPGDERGR
jgi:hypothetical protein